MRRLLAGSLPITLAGCVAAAALTPPPTTPAPLPSPSGAPGPAASAPAPAARPSAELATGWVSATAAASFSPFLPPPARRTAGNRLTVDSPPRARRYAFYGRLRSQIDGTLSAGAERVWVGPEVPMFVPLEFEGQELFLLDPTPSGEHLAFYRAPYGGRSCQLSGKSNCAFNAAFFDKEGKVSWALNLNAHMSLPEHLEIQDIRQDRGVLFFNEACQSYSSEARGQCSSLVALDPKEDKLLWRTRPLTSNGEFLVLGDLLFTGYGFTGESSHLFLVRRSDGNIVSSMPTRGHHNHMTLLPDGRIDVMFSNSGEILKIRIENPTGPSPRLVPG